MQPSERPTDNYIEGRRVTRDNGAFFGFKFRHFKKDSCAKKSD